MVLNDSGRWRHLEGKTLLVLDGSQKAIEIVENAQNMGLRVIITDYNSPTASPAKLFADEYFNVSVSDVEAVVELIREQNVSGVLPGFSDRWLPTYAKICQAAGLPAYATPEQLELFTDKNRYKKLLQQFEIPTVQGFDVEQARRGGIASENYPLIIKPADGSGSRGISICNTFEQLSAGLSVALDYSWTNETLVERYLPGDEATVFWVFQDGEHYVSMLWNRHMHEFGGGAHRLPVAYSSPSHLIPRYLEEIAPKVREMLASVAVHNGIMFMQGLVRDGNFFTYDIGFRATPTQEYRVTEHFCDFNPLKMLINFSVAGSMGEPLLGMKVNPAHAGYGFNVSTLIQPGLVTTYEGIDTVRVLPGVLSSSTAMVPGDELPGEAVGQLRQVAVRTIGVADTAADLGVTMRQVKELIDVRDPSGESLVLDSIAPINFEEQLL